MNINEKSKMMLASGFTQEEVDAWVEQQKQILIDSGFSQEEITEHLGVKKIRQQFTPEYLEEFMYEHGIDEYPTLFDPTNPPTEEETQNIISSITKKIENYELGPEDIPQSEGWSDMSLYWLNLGREVKRWSGGKEPEMFEYFKRGIGKSNFNLALQVHSGKDLGIDAMAALEPEPDDTGHIERWVETMGTIGSDTPIYAAAAAGTGYLFRSPTASAFAAGFVNESIKGMYVDALVNRETDNWKGWWNSFITEGLGTGLKAGVNLAVGTQAPAWLGVKSVAGKLATQYAAFLGAGAALEQKMPTKDEMINLGLVLGSFSPLFMFERNHKMMVEEVKKTDASVAQVVGETMNNPRKLEDLSSENMTKFRDEVPPSKRVQPFDPATDVKVTRTELFPDATFKVTTQDMKNIQLKDIDTQAYREARESGLKEDMALEMARPPKRMEDVPASDAVNQVLQSVEFNIPKPRPGLQTIKGRFITSFFDRLHPIFEAQKRYTDSGGKIDTLSPYEGMRIQPGMVGRAMHYLLHGTLDAKTLNINGKSLTQVLEPIKTERDFKDFTAYATSRRAIEKHAQGKETGVPIEAAKRTVEELGSKYEVAFKELVEFENRTLQYMVDAGILSPEMANAMREMNKDYVPFYRVMEEGAAQSPNNFSTTVKNPFKTFKGSERKIINPIESVFLNTMNNLMIAERNIAFVRFIEMVEQKPELFPFIKKVPGRVSGTKITPEELSSVFDGTLKPEFADGLTVFRRNGQLISETEIAIFRNGKREVWEVGRDIGNSLKHINGYQQSMLIKMLGTPTRLLRAGATLDPGFMLRNLERDALGAGIFSKRGFVPLLDNFIGAFHLMKKDSLYKKWVSSGAMQSMFVSMDRTYFNKDISAYLTKGKLRNVVSNPLEMLRILSEIFESSGRIGEFKRSYYQMKREGKLTDRDIIERSGFESRDITVDFAKMGTQIQGLNAISAFFNARLQGYAKIAEAMKDRPVQTLAKIAAFIQAPSILLWIKNHDDPRYQALPEYQKDLFWVVITGDGTIDEPDDYKVWLIPKPFEPGLLFGTGTEKVLDFMFKEDANTPLEFLADFGSDLTYGLVPIPDFAKPFFEITANKSYFNDSPIVPRGTEKMLPEFQYDLYTSPTMKELGGLIGDLTFGYGPQSPSKLEHVYNSWTGTLGKYALQTADKLLVTVGVADEPIPPEARLEDLPVIRAFLARKPSGAAQPITDFYKEFEKIKGKVDALDKLIEENRTDEISNFITPEDVRLLPLIKIQKAMSNINSLIRKVHQADIPANEKRQFIDDYYLTMIKLAEKGLEITKSYNPPKKQ